MGVFFLYSPQTPKLMQDKPILKFKSSKKDKTDNWIDNELKQLGLEGQVPQQQALTKPKNIAMQPGRNSPSFQIQDKLLKPQFAKKSEAPATSAQVLYNQSEVNTYQLKQNKPDKQNPPEQASNVSDLYSKLKPNIRNRIPSNHEKDDKPIFKPKLENINQLPSELEQEQTSEK